MPDVKPSPRRRHDQTLKQHVLALCAEPGASVAQVALSHGLNANLVHKWRRLAQPAPAAVSRREFVPVSLAPEPASVLAAPLIELEIQRGPLSVRMRWPTSESAACAAWLRELLR